MAGHPHSKAPRNWPSDFTDGLPDAHKPDALNRFRDLGLPTRHLEAWKQTNLRPLAERSFVLAAAPQSKAAMQNAITDARLPEHDCMVFVNGAFQPAASEFDAQSCAALAATNSPPEAIGTRSEAFAAIDALNEAYASDGLVLTLGDGESLRRPLQILDIALTNTAPAMHHLRHTLILGENSRADIVETAIQLGDTDHLATAIWRAAAGSGSHLTVSRAQRLPETGAFRLQRLDLSAGRDAQVHVGSADLGGRIVRTDTDVRLAQPGSRATVTGVYLPGGRGVIDNHTTIDHAAAHTTSRELFRGAASGRGKGVFNGRVVVQKDAQQVESDQQTAALLLSPRAEIAAKPELEIYADDVKCAHGNSIGQLDEAAVFYLRSRGLDEPSARQILTESFLQTALAEMPNPAAVEQMTDALSARLKALQAGPDA